MKSPGALVRESLLSTPQALKEVLEHPFSLNGLAQALKGRRVILHGCGSSFHIALILESLLRKSYSGDVLAIPSSELVFTPESYFKEESALISFSRSGKTSESATAIKIFKSYKGGPAVSFLSTEEGPIAEFSDFLYSTQVQEESIPSVKTFSAMLFLALRVLDAAHPFSFDPTKVLHRVGEEVERALAFSEEIQGDFSSFIFLGSGPFYGLSRELALKVIEMARGRAFSYHSLEFRHGPHLLLDSNSLFFLLTHPESSSYPEEVRLFRELETRAQHIAIDCRGTHSNPLSFRPKSRMSFWESFFVQLLLGQALAYRIGLKRGIDPDQPENLSPYVELPEWEKFIAPEA